MKMSRKIVLAIILTAITICMGKVVKADTGIVNTDTLNLRKEPSTSSTVLKQLNRNEEMEIVEENGNWYKVEIKGTTGYVHKDYVKKVETKKDDNEIDDNNETTNSDENKNDEDSNPISEEITLEKQLDIYILPLINSTKISKTAVGEKVRVITVTNNWIYIEATEVNGWIIKNNINKESNNNNEQNNIQNPQPNENQNTETSIEQKTMYVNSPSIYVRKGPGTNYEIVDSLILNASVTVIGEDGDWYKVKISNTEGYIAKRLLSNTKQQTSSRGETTSREYNSSEEIIKEPVSIQEQLVEYAKQYLGCKYVYGGAGPTTFDCSGFTMYVYNKFGVNLTHSATAQSKKGTYVAKEDLQPGDLVFFKDYETMEGIGHCGIYIGNGDFIHASSGTGYCVKISTLLSGSYNTRYETARRVL